MTDTVARPAPSLRDATEADRSFLRTLYAETHGSDFDASDLSADSQELLVGHQFAVRERAYAAYPGIRSSIVLVEDRPAGRLLVSDDRRQLHLVDIALLSHLRGGGLGTALVRALTAEADERGLPVTLQVERANPAQRLYARLGFASVGQDAFRIQMRREPRDPRPGAGPSRSGQTSRRSS